MAEENPQLQAALRALDQEFEDGDITEKGYQKRRTLILSQYLSPQNEPGGAERGLRVHRHPSLEGQDSHRVSSPMTDDSRGSEYLPANLRAYPGGPGDSTYTSNIQERELGFALGTGPPPPASPRHDSLGVPSGRREHQGDDLSTSETLHSHNYAFYPPNEYDDPQATPYGHPAGDYAAHPGMVESQQEYFSDFAGQQDADRRDSYGPGLRYSQTETFSPSTTMAPPLMSPTDAPGRMVVDHQAPLEPRDIPFDVYDSHNPKLLMSQFDNLPTVLRHRARTDPKQAAYWVLDQRGKELASITWDKLGSRAEKVAQVIRDKSSLYRGDRVALMYRDTEVIDFAVALLGCFIAGVVAVPINNLEDYQNLNTILQTTQAHLALTTEYNLKNFQRDITTQKLNWPRGVEWWKTNDFGSYHPKKKQDVPPLQVPDLAYIEFSRAPTGEMRGVVMSHRTIMHQMACLAAIVSSTPKENSSEAPKEPQVRPHGEALMTYLDPRQGIGMILGVLFAVYGGNTTVWLEPHAVETPGLYASLITKYRATVMAADYTGLKRAVYNYQQDPMTTRNFKKNSEPNFSALRLCLIDTLTIDCEFHEVLADRWLRPLRNPRSREIVAPMLCLPEHGGMVVSVRDWLGGEERMGCTLTHNMHPQESKDDKKDEKKKEKKDDESKEAFGSSLIGGSSAPVQKQTSRTDLGEVILDKEALKNNQVVVLAMGEDARKSAESLPKNAVRVGAFGYPIPDATLSIVDPETGLLCPANIIGEIWVDSPSLSGGFWALSKHTEAIFHARPYRFQEGSPTPVLVEPEFLRTGLLGCVIEGKIFVLGLYEDRLRQKVEWVERGSEVAEYRYFFVQHLILSIMKNVPNIHDCSAFDVFINDEHLPVVLMESYAASTAPLTNGAPPRQLDMPLLESLAERCMQVLYQEHHLRVYCIMITAPNTLPRLNKNGRREIGNMLCRKEFDNASLPCVHVKFGAENAVQNIPVGVDPTGGMWSIDASRSRQEALMSQDKQYSGVDYRNVVMDDRTSTPLNEFSTIVDLLQWRISRQAEELAYCTIDGRGREGKGITWKKFDTKVAAVAMYLKNKVKLRPGDHVILMYTHSEDFVYAVHACLCLGIIAIPVAPVDQNRLSEDAPALLHMVSDFTVKGILVNSDVNDLLKQKVVSQHIKQSASVLRINVPQTYNTAKASKQSHGCRHLGLTASTESIKNRPAMIWTYWTPDQRRFALEIGHDTVMGMCKVQKETCQMSSARPILGSVRSSIGLGFLHTCLMGCYVGAPTYLISPVDFAANPLTLFLTLARYKVKDAYATSQMLDYAMGTMAAKGFQLHELKNLMISTDGRPRPDIYQKVRLHFAPAGLDRNAINTFYSHVLNPMVASRSYMCVEPIELWLDAKYLRHGYIYPVVPPETGTSGLLLLQDSGMVPVCTQIAIVNPETRCLSHVGEYGEIWIQSEASAKSFYRSKQEFDKERFKGRIVDGNPQAEYVRTGDLGFLHSVTRPIGPGGQPVEMQVLFVLGSIGETFDINGLNHFPVDIEATIEKCHYNVVRGGSAVFQAGGLAVALVEVTRKSYLASMVPVIVNSVLGEHQIVLDIIAFVPHGDFPRSRLGEKQRGKILSSWVTRKMRTIAQFSIRDSDISGIQQQLSADRHDQSKTGSIASGNTRQHAPLMEEEDFAGLQPMDATSHQSRDSEDPLHHTPLTPEHGSVSGEQSSHENRGFTEHNQSYNPSEFDDSGRQSLTDTHAAPRAESPIDASLHFGGDNNPPSSSGPMAASSAALDASTPTEQNRGFHYDDTKSHPAVDDRSSHPHVEKSSPSPPTSDAPVASGPPLMPTRGRDSLPSQQKRLSSIPAGFTGQPEQQHPSASHSVGDGRELASHGGGGNGSRQVEEQERYDMDDWPEEAVLYQQHASGYDAK